MSEDDVLANEQAPLTVTLNDDASLEAEALQKKVEQEKLDEIHAAIDKEIEAHGKRSGAVPRSLSAFRERSPGDTSPEAPPGTPTRLEGAFRQNRGEGLPMTRAGGPLRLATTDDEKTRYWEQKRARLKAQKEADKTRRKNKQDFARKRKSFKVANSPVKVMDFANFIQGEQRRLMMLSGRIESFLIAVSIVSDQVGDESFIREFCERFKAAIPEANDIWLKWREIVHSFTEAEINLVDMRKAVNDWNSNRVNPRINRQCFDAHWILWKFGLQNPDATLTVEEKKEFALSLGYAEPEAEAMVAGSFPKPGAEEQEEVVADEEE